MLGRLRTIINGALAPLGVKVERVKDEGAALRNITFLRTVEPGLSTQDQETRRLRNVLTYTKASGSPYSAATCESAYHSIEINGQVFAGQRNPQERLSIAPYDFTGKTVLDLGCNQGGMIFAVADRIKSGVGVDYDGRMVNAANRVKASRESSNVSFYVFNLETEPLPFLGNLLQQQGVDIVFLLSVCMWIANWRRVIDYARSIAPAMLFESNGSPAEQKEQEEYLRAVYGEVTQLQGESPDDPMQTARKLFLCRC